MKTITESEIASFRELEKEINKNLTFDDLQEMNENITTYKREYKEKEAELKKYALHFSIISAFAILFVFYFGVFMLPPFIIGLSFLSFKAYKAYKVKRLANIIVNDLEFSKQEHMDYVNGISK